MSGNSRSTLKKGVGFVLVAVMFTVFGAVLWDSYGPAPGNAEPSSDTVPVVSHYVPNGDIQYAAQYDSYQSDNSDFDSPFVKVAEILKPSVVNITVTLASEDNPHDKMMQFDPFREFFERQPRSKRPRVAHASGTGLIISADGKVLTNNHVVRDASKITVELIDGSEREAKIIGTDPETDLALLDIGKVDKDHVAHLGDSDKIRIGDWAIAMGNSMQLDWTLSVGVISAKGRSELPIAGGGPIYQDFIQTDASINFGNSGGPLANIRGEVIGINTAINAAANNIGFAIPINLAKDVVLQLEKTGHVTRGYLGMVPNELDPLKREALGLEDDVEGIFVESVQPGTPAEEGGLEASDVITKVNGKAVKDVTEFRFQIAAYAPGEKIRMTVIHNGKKKKLDFTIANRADYINMASGVSPGAEEREWMGIRVLSLSSPQAQSMDLEVDRGVLVAEIADDSPALGKLQQGDVITSVNQKEIETLDDWYRITGEIGDTDKAVLVMFYRGGKGPSRFVAFKK